MRERNPNHRVAALGLLLVVAATLLPAQEAAKPQAVALEAVKDVGVVDKGEKIRHTFEIRNEGSAALRLERVKPTCGCTVTEYDEVIAPGEVGSIQAVVDTTEFRGPIAKSVTVYTNDPGNPRINLVVKANIKAQIEISPGYVRFVVVQGEEFKSSEQTIWSPDLADLQILEVKSPYEYVGVEHRLLESGDSDYRDDANRWRIDISLSQDAPVGQMADFVKVVTNHPRQKLVKIPVSGFVRPVLAVTPQVADFGRRELTEPQTATLEVKNLGSEAIELGAASTDLPGLEAEIESVEAGRLFNLVLTLGSGMEKGRFRGKVTIETTSPEQPVVEVGVTGTVL